MDRDWLFTVAGYRIEDGPDLQHCAILHVSARGKQETCARRLALENLHKMEIFVFAIQLLATRQPGTELWIGVDGNPYLDWE